MWLFKTPEINSKSKSLFVIAHYFELLMVLGFILIGIFSLFFGLNIISDGRFLSYPLHLMFCSAILALIILSYIAIFKKETLKTNFNPIIESLPVQTFSITDNETIKGKEASKRGILYIACLIIIVLIFIYYLFYI